MDGINISKQASVNDFVKAMRLLGSGGDITQRTFGGSVVLLDFTRRATLTLGVIA
jgi:hypothetical protein